VNIDEVMPTSVGTPKLSDDIIIAAEDFQHYHEQAARSIQRCTSAAHVLAHVLEDRSAQVEFDDSVQHTESVALDGQTLLDETLAQLREAYERLQRTDGVTAISSNNPLWKWLGKESSRRPEIQWFTTTQASKQHTLSPQNYLGDIRDELKDIFKVSLRELCGMVGVSYATLVNIGAPDRRPHASSTRTMLLVHSIARGLERVMGIDAAHAWLRGEGVRLLKAHDLDAFEKFADARLFPARGRSDVGYSIEEDERELADIGPARLSSALRAKARRRR